MSTAERPSVMERAVHLARSGPARSITEVRQMLGQERYEDVDQHLSGRGAQNQIKALIAERLAGDADRRA